MRSEAPGINGDRNSAVSIAIDHGDDAVQQIAQVFGQFVVVALDQAFTREISVRRERQVAQQVVTDGVSAELVDESHRFHNVAGGLGDTLSLQRNKAMCCYLAR